MYVVMLYPVLPTLAQFYLV